MRGDHTLNAAAGTVIEYTLSDDDVLTIQNVLNLNTPDTDGSIDTEDDVDVESEEIAYIGENANAVLAGVATQTPNLQYTLAENYENGDGYVTVNYGRNELIYAVDLNTIAFYYVDSDTYGVATGWENMSDVDRVQADGSRTGVQVYPVLEKRNNTYVPTNLAEVVLFNAEPTANTEDWLLVLTANAVSRSTLELNVVFEDGTTAAINVDRDDYNTEFNNPSGSYYMVAYTYSQNTDGTYELDLDSRTGATTARLLQNGTLSVKNNTADDYEYAGIKYPTIIGTSAIWDVNDASSADDEVSAGSFSYDLDKNAVIITTNDDRILQTAWVWDIDDDPTAGVDDPGDLRVTYDQQTVRVYNPDNATQLELARAITNELRDKGFTNVRIASATGLDVTDSAMGTVTAEDVDSGLTITIPVEQVYRVTYNGTFVGYVGEGETITFRSTNSYFQVNDVDGISSNSYTDVSVASGTATFTAPVDGAGNGTSSVESLENDTANKTFAIVDAHHVTVDSDVKVVKASDNKQVNDNRYVATGTKVTVTTTLGGSQQLTATVGTTTTNISAPGTNPSATYEIKDDVSFDVVAQVAAPTAAELDEILQNDTEFNGIQRIVSTNVEVEVDEANNKIYLSSETPVTSFKASDTLSAIDQTALNIFWWGNSGLASHGNATITDILSHYNTTKHPGQSNTADQWAIVCVTIGNNAYYIGVGNGDATTHNNQLDGYTIDFSGLQWNP